MARPQWFNDPVTDTPLSAAMLNDLEARKPETEYMAINVMDAPYNVKCDGATDDTAAWQAAIDALPDSGGELVCRKGISVCNGTLDLQEKMSVRIKGEGRAPNVGGQGTVLFYTGTGARFFDARSSEGLRVEGITFMCQNSGFTGNLVDLDILGGGTDTVHATFDSCWFGGSPATGGVNAAKLVSLNKTHSIGFRDCAFMRGQIGVQGKIVDADYSNSVSFQRCLFQHNYVAHTKNAGDSWHFDCCVFEPLVDGTAGVYRHTAAVWAKGMVFTSCWAGDIIVASGPHIKWAGRGLTLVGGEWAGEHASCTSIIEIDENNCAGISIMGVAFTGPSPYAVKFGSVTGTLGVFLGPCDYLTTIVPTDGAPPNSLVYAANGKIQFGNSASATLYQDGAGTAGIKTDGYLAAAGVVYGGSFSVTGDVVLNTAGNTLKLKEGTNAKMGTAVLTAGTVTVSTTAVTATSRIFLTCQLLGGTAGALRVTSRTAGTSFVITSTSGTDTSTVAWMMIEPS